MSLLPVDSHAGRKTLAESLGGLGSVDPFLLISHPHGTVIVTLTITPYSVPYTYII